MLPSGWIVRIFTYKSNTKKQLMENSIAPAKYPRYPSNEARPKHMLNGDPMMRYSAGAIKTELYHY